MDDKTGTKGDGAFEPLKGVIVPPKKGEVPQPAPLPKRDEPEARIIEETIVRPPPPPIPPAQLAPPTPVVPQVAVPPILPMREENLDAPPPVPQQPIPVPFKSPPPSNPIAPPVQSAETPPHSPLPDRPMVLKPSADVQPRIGEILQSTKLPENRGSEAPLAPEKRYDTSLARAVADDKSIILDTPAKEGSETDPRLSSVVAPLHTLKQDLQGIVKDKKISLVRAAALEEDKKRVSERIQPHIVQHQERRSLTLNIVIAVVLFATLGSAAFFGIALIMKERGGIVPSTSSSSLLFSESALPFPIENLSALDIKSSLSQMRTAGGAALGSITRIVPTVPAEIPEGGDVSEEARVREATFEEFLRAIGTHAPSELIRALEAQFFFGLHTVDENALLMVIPVSSYERAFAGMLDWEDTLNSDLTPAFSAVPDTNLGSDGLLQKRRFEDLVMRNYDVRALKDDAGVVQLYYSFPTRDFLIIAESPYSFAEVLARLRAERKL